MWSLPECYKHSWEPWPRRIEWRAWNAWTLNTGRTVTDQEQLARKAQKALSFNLRFAGGEPQALDLRWHLERAEKHTNPPESTAEEKRISSMVLIREPLSLESRPLNIPCCQKRGKRPIRTLIPMTVDVELGARIRILLTTVVVRLQSTDMRITNVQRSSSGNFQEFDVPDLLWPFSKARKFRLDSSANSQSAYMKSNYR